MTAPSGASSADATSFARAAFAGWVGGDTSDAKDLVAAEADEVTDAVGPEKAGVEEGLKENAVVADGAEPKPAKPAKRDAG